MLSPEEKQFLRKMDFIALWKNEWISTGVVAKSVQHPTRFNMKATYILNQYRSAAWRLQRLDIKYQEAFDKREAILKELSQAEAALYDAQKERALADLEEFELRRKLEKLLDGKEG